jgi:hypothetical protein
MHDVRHAGQSPDMKQTPCSDKHSYGDVNGAFRYEAVFSYLSRHILCIAIFPGSQESPRWYLSAVPTGQTPVHRPQR